MNYWNQVVAAVVAMAKLIYDTKEAIEQQKALKEAANQIINDDNSYVSEISFNDLGNEHGEQDVLIKVRQVDGESESKPESPSSTVINESSDNRKNKES